MVSGEARDGPVLLLLSSCQSKDDAVEDGEGADGVNVVVGGGKKEIFMAITTLG